jgi:hypothetical protein
MANPMPFTPSQLFAKISQPTLNILDALANIARETSWDLVSAPGTGPGGQQLGTLSAARIPSKPFIVGFIPPDVAVNFVPIANNQSVVATVTNSNAKVVGPSIQAPQSLLQQLAHAPGHSAQFYQQLQSVAAAVGANPADMLAVMLNESGTNPQQKSFANNNGVPVAVGLIQFTQASANDLGTSQQALLGMTDVQQLAYVQKYYSNCNGGGTYPSTGSLYLATFAPAFLKNGNDADTVIFSKATSGQYYSQNTGLDHGNKGYITVGDMTLQMDLVKQTGAYQELVNAYNAATGSSINPQEFGGSTTPAGSIPTAAPVSSTTIMANGLNTTDPTGNDPLANLYGRQLSVANKDRIADVQKQTNYLSLQIQLIQQTPALMMLVNPSEFNRGYEHNIDPVKTRSGYVVNMWLEKPMVISSKGVTAGQYVFQTDGGGGISALNRIQSVSYQNLMSLVSMFKNNGNIFTDSSFGDSNTGIPLIALSLFIYYDNHIYIGAFDDFEVTDDGNKPYNLSYNWKFTVRYDIDTNQISDSTVATLGLTAGTSAARIGY